MYIKIDRRVEVLYVPMMDLFFSRDDEKSNYDYVDVNEISKKRSILIRMMRIFLKRLIHKIEPGPLAINKSSVWEGRLQLAICLIKKLFLRVF